MDKLSLALHLTLGSEALAQPDAGPNEGSFSLAQVARPIRQPAFSLTQRCAAQEHALIPVGALPLAQRRPQALLPGAESAVGCHPIPQPLPLLTDQRPMGHFNHLGAGAGLPACTTSRLSARYRANGRSSPQLSGSPGGGYPRCPRQGAPVAQRLPRPLPIGLVQRRQHLIGVAGQRTLHLADLLVVDRHGSARPMHCVPTATSPRIPAEQQRARLFAHIVEDAVHQPWLEGRAVLTSRPLDSRTQFSAGHRSQ